MKNGMNQNPASQTKEGYSWIIIYAAVQLIIIVLTLFAPILDQKLWCMGYAQGLAQNKNIFNPFVESITLDPAPVAFGLPHIYLMSLLIRIGIHANIAYDLMLIFWTVASTFFAFKICRFFGLCRRWSAFFMIFFPLLPGILFHHGYGALGTGYMLFPAYVYPVLCLFSEKEWREKIGYAILTLVTTVVAIFMDGYSFVMVEALNAMMILCSLRKATWKKCLSFSFPVYIFSLLCAYLLYKSFAGVYVMEKFSAEIFAQFNAFWMSYFLPTQNFLLPATYFSISLPCQFGYFQGFLFSLPLFLVNIVFVFLYGKRVRGNLFYYGFLLVALIAFWLSMGPIFYFSKDLSFPTLNSWVYMLPGLSSMRAAARWGILVQIALLLSLLMLFIHSCKKSMLPLLIVLFVLNFIPSSQVIKMAKNHKKALLEISETMISDLRPWVSDRETILFLPIKNSFISQYVAGRLNLNCWNVGGDKNMKRLMDSYPQSIKEITDHWCSRNNEIPRQDMYDGFIFEILNKTQLDAVVFDYNITWPMPQDLNRNVHKRFALEMEKRLKKYGVIDIQHARYFSIYRLKPEFKHQNVPSIQKKVFDIALGNILQDTSHKEFSDRFAVFLDKGFASPEQWGVWSNEKNAIFYLKLPRGHSEILRLKFLITPFYGMKYAHIYQDGLLIHTWKFTSSERSNYFLDVKVPKDQDILQLRFEQFDLHRPCDYTRKSQDSRTLGIGFFSVDILDSANNKNREGKNETHYSNSMF